MADYYQHLFDFSPVGQLLLRRDGSLFDANLTASDMLGLDRAELIGKPLSVLIDDKDQEHFFRIFRQAWSDTETHTFEASLHAGADAMVEMRLDVRGFIEPEQGEHRYQVILTDISRRLLQEQRDKTFFAIASHELRTPITNISLAFELISHAVAQPDDTTHIQDTLEVAQRGIKRLQRLAESIALLHGSEAGASLNIQSQVDLRELAEEVIQLNLIPAAKQDMHIELVIDTAFTTVDTDPDKVMQVITNLLQNAIRYSVTGDQLLVRLDGKTNWLRCSIIDHGLGVPAGIQEEIFLPFVQGEPAIESSHELKGMGLGLSICHTIIEMLGGRIGFHSEKNIETVFWFELPRSF